MEVAMGTVQVKTTGTTQPTITVRIDGDIDHTTADHLRGALIDIIMRRRPHRVVVDLDGITALDSATIGTLRAAHATAEDVHLNLIVQTSQSTVRQQLDHDGIRHRERV
jgi:stage II sporulation protein AA (anti-sigma F factor antagonist)